VCPGGWWPQKTTVYLCLEGPVWQKCCNSQFDRKLTCVWKAGGRKIRQITCLEGVAKVLEFAIRLQIYVCLEGWWPKNTTSCVCLEGSVFQKRCNSQFDCKFTCVWKAGGPKIRQFIYVWKARCGKSAQIRNLTAILRVSGRLVAQKYDKLRMSGRLGVAKVLEFALLLQIYVCLEGWWPKKS
jgi:hypothetical protein